METCPPQLRSVLTTLFLEQHKDTLNKFKGPWFFPKWMGGLGLHNCEALTHLDLHQGHCARQLAAKNPLNLSLDKEWLHYDLYNGLVRDHSFGLVTKRNFCEYEGEEDFSSVFTAFVYTEVWAKQGVEHLMNFDTTPEKKLIRRLERRWKEVQSLSLQYQKKGEWPQCDPEVFRSEQKPSILPVTVLQNN